MNPVLTRAIVTVRSVTYLAFLTLTTVVYCFVMLLTFVLPLMWRYQAVRGYIWLQLRALQVICGLRYRIEGRALLPTEPSVIMAKHQSTFETFVLLYELPHSAYVAKRELLMVPFFGWGMSALRYITIDRKAGKKVVQQIVDQAHDRFALGLWVTIFPEGTRKAPGEKPNYKIGGAILAAETDRQVVPVVHNSGEFWPRHSLRKWPGEVTFRIGPAIATTGRAPQDILADTQNWIEGEYPSIHDPERFPYG